MQLLCVTDVISALFREQSQKSGNRIVFSHGKPPLWSTFSSETEGGKYFASIKTCVAVAASDSSK